MTDRNPEKAGQGVAAKGGSAKPAPESGEDLSAKIDELLSEIEESRAAMEKAVADSPKDEEVAAAVDAMVGQVAEIAEIAAVTNEAATPASAEVVDAPAPSAVEPPAPLPEAVAPVAPEALQVAPAEPDAAPAPEARQATPPIDEAVSQAVDDLLASAEQSLTAAPAATTIPDGATPLHDSPALSATEPEVAAAPVEPPAETTAPASAEEHDTSQAVDALLAEAQPAPSSASPAPQMIPDGATPMEVAPTMTAPEAVDATVPARASAAEPTPAASSPAPAPTPAVDDADVSKAVDDLLAEVETPQVEAAAALSPGGQPGTPDVAPPPRQMEVVGAALATPGAPATRDTSHLASPTPSTPAVEIAAATPKAPEPAAPVSKGSFFVWLWGMISPRLRRALGLLSAPLAGQPRVVRDSVGWVAAWTVFLAACLWIYLGFVRQPQTHQRPVGTYDFAAGELPEPPEPPEPKPESSEGHGAGHGEKASAPAAHGEGHDAKKADPKKTTKKPDKKTEKKPAKKDAHAKAAGHGEAQGGGHGGH